MSSEKTAKSSGTRHKARECALQMLFAVDLVDAAKLDVGRYWSEVGLEELHHGLTSTVWTVVEDLAKVSRHANELRSLLKRFEPHEKNTSRLEKLKRITTLTESADPAYRNFVNLIEHGEPQDPSESLAKFEEIRTTFSSLSVDFQNAVDTRRFDAPREDL